MIEDSATNLEKRIDLVKGKPVWIDNFGCGASIEKQIALINRALPFLDLSEPATSVVSWSSSSLGRRWLSGIVLVAGQS